MKESCVFVRLAILRSTELNRLRILSSQPTPKFAPGAIDHPGGLAVVVEPGKEVIAHPLKPKPLSYLPESVGKKALGSDQLFKDLHHPGLR